MPYMHCDLSEDLTEKQKTDLIDVIYAGTRIAFDYSEEQAKELVSVFTASYDKLDRSAAMAEVEVRAKIGEFDQPGYSREELRQQKMAPYKEGLEAFIDRERLSKGIVFTITFEDWSVAFIPVATGK